MAIITKTTVGFVTQTFDTETGKFLNQSFTASDEISFQDQNGSPVDSFSDYLSFDMQQPEDEKSKAIAILRKMNSILYFKHSSGYPCLMGSAEEIKSIIDDLATVIK